MKVAACLIVKKERYLSEWLDYYVKLGIDHIFMYMNDWTTNIEHPNLTKFQWNGREQQLPVYNHCIQKEKDNYDYILFLDADEYLVLHKHKDIKELLKEYKPENTLAINWIIFGSDKLTQDGDSLIKQYTKRDKEVNKHIKVIVNTKVNQLFVNPHFTNKLCTDTNGKMFIGPFNQNGPINICQINHYYFRSKDEWKERCERGRVDIVDTYQMDIWDKDANKHLEVEDLKAIQFLYGT